MAVDDATNSLVQINKNSRWVELKDCQNLDGEIELHHDLENTAVANCKLRRDADAVADIDAAA